MRISRITEAVDMERKNLSAIIVCIVMAISVSAIAPPASAFVDDVEPTLTIFLPLDFGSFLWLIGGIVIGVGLIVFFLIKRKTIGKILIVAGVAIMVIWIFVVSITPIG